MAVHDVGPVKSTSPIATLGSGGEFAPSTATMSRPEVRPPEISTSRWTAPVKGTEPSTRNACHQYPWAPELGKDISRKPPGVPPALRYVPNDPVPNGSKVQLPASKPKPLFTVLPEPIAWIPGTTYAGAATRAAKSVITKMMKPTRAIVHKIERTVRPPDGAAGGRYAHAAVGRPQRGQKFPRNRVPQRGHGHPIGAAVGSGGAGAEAIAGAPHRGQKRPSKIAPQRTHCIRSHTRAPRYLMLRCAAARKAVLISIPREDLYRVGRLRGPPSRAAEAPRTGGMTAWSTRREAGRTPTCGSRRFGRRRSISGETISSRSRGNEGPPPKGRRSSSPFPEATNLPDKTERFKRSLTFPDDPDVRACIADKIRSLQSTRADAPRSAKSDRGL